MNNISADSDAVALNWRAQASNLRNFAYDYVTTKRNPKLMNCQLNLLFFNDFFAIALSNASRAVFASNFLALPFDHVAFAWTFLLILEEEVRESAEVIRESVFRVSSSFDGKSSPVITIEKFVTKNFFRSSYHEIIACPHPRPRAPIAHHRSLNPIFSHRREKESGSASSQPSTNEPTHNLINR